ncbi:MAG: hypothetical protein HKO86_03795 [Gammaproteobacteria bacterium]|nr:hypothetical protein [Gammaproteobacteria bacterium]
MAVALIVLAVAFTLLRTFLPYATGYIAEIEQGISEQIGLPVSIGSLDADMHWFTPRLKVLDLVIYKENSTDRLFTLPEANFSLAYIDSIRFMMPMVGEISLHGAELFIERHHNGKWVIQGFELYERESSKGSEDLLDLMLSADIALIDSRIHWKDYTGRSRNFDFEGASVMLENHLGTQYIEVDVGLPPDLGERFKLVAELDGDLRDFATVEALIHVSGKELVASNWISTTRLREFIQGSGRLSTDFWVHINKAEITRFSATLSATDLVLSNVNDSSKSWTAKQVTTNMFWRALNQGWRLDVRDFNLDKDEVPWSEKANIVIANDEDDWRLLASYIKPSDISPFIHVLPDIVDTSAFDSYLGYVPAGELFNVEAVFTAGDQPDLQLSAGFSDLGLNIEDRKLSVYGLDGELVIDSDNFELSLESRNVTATVGDLLRWPLQFDEITGKVAIGLKDDDIMISAPEVYARNQHVETVTRLFVDIPAEQQVFVDIHTDFTNGIGKHAYRYVPAGILHKGLVTWLDEAFVDGFVPSGSFIFHGAAGEFPFRENQGIMQVLFDVEDGRLHFLDGWPDVNNASATVRFHNETLSVENARGYEASGAKVQLEAHIPDLSNALLHVSADVMAPAEEIQRYVWNSALDPILGRALEQFQASGSSEIKLEIVVPLGAARKKAGEHLQVSGTLVLDDNEMFFPVTDHLFTDINGELSFTTTSLQGENISADFYGQPVSISVHNNDDDDKPESLFHIRGELPVNAALKKFDWDFPSILAGSSFWDMVLHVPHKVTDYTIRLQANSMLHGVSIGVSEIVKKSADELVPVEIDFKLLNEARSLMIKSPDRLDFVATIDDADNWQFNVSSPVVTGKGIINANLDVSTTADFDFDFLNLSALLSGDGSVARKWGLNASKLPSMRLKSKSFEWKDWKFSNVEFGSDYHPRGMVINKIRIDDPFLQVSGKGSWLRRSWRLDEETTISFDVTSPNIGDTLQRLGYARYVDKSKMQATLHWSWPGAPYRFGWSKMSGNTSVAFEQGIVSDIDPGAGGRFLGLFNLIHLPKRLSLDFADVYKKGFVFDSIRGTYIFADGDAVTQDTEILASAADMTMMGRIGVEDQDYDLVTIVRPHSSVATFAGGTLVAGPTIGVGLVLLQEIFGLDLLGKEIYTITGEWADPEIKQITSGNEESEDLFDEF